MFAVAPRVNTPSSQRESPVLSIIIGTLTFAITAVLVGVVQPFIVAST